MVKALDLSSRTWRLGGLLVLGHSWADATLIKSTLISASGLGAVKNVVERFFWAVFVGFLEVYLAGAVGEWRAELVEWWELG